MAYPNDEDCLTLNVVRGADVTANDSLPVAIWIHGGGFTQGSGRDQRYNLSFIIDNAYEIGKSFNTISSSSQPKHLILIDILGKPFIGVSINYRLGPWGFLTSDQVMASGNANNGLKDQRKAMAWVQENIAAFGGDPNHVTIWGESAGALSVGLQLTAYGGRDDGLFHAGIMESGGPIQAFAENGTSYFQPIYDELVAEGNCTEAIDTLQCLREIPIDLALPLFNSTIGNYFVPSLDGDIVAGWGSSQLAAGEYVHVPILIGTNTDEGSAFAPTGINSSAEFKEYLTSGASSANIPDSVATKVLEVYPESYTNSSDGIPAEFDFVPDPSYGAEWRRVAAYTGDRYFIAGRRLTAQTWSAAGIPAYTYRFNAAPTNIPWYLGVTHFQEVAFVFLDLGGYGYAQGPFINASAATVDLAYMAAGMWASFIVDYDPNSSAASNVTWPLYSANATATTSLNETLDIVGMNMVFDANVTSYIEIDDFRAEGIRYLNEANLVWAR